MAEMATNSPTFSHFSSLPLGLRNQIWRDALPDKDNPALFFYKRGCWTPRRLTDSDEGYDATDDRLNLELEFRHDVLGHVHVRVPLGFVNHEARVVGLAWICEQGIETRFREDRRCQDFARPFDPNRDALYMAPEDWIDFCCEPYDRMRGFDLYDRNVSCGPDLERIAVPEALLRREAAVMSDIFEWFCSVAVLYVIIDAQPDAQFEERRRQRWELESAQGRVFFWNHKNGGFDVGGGEDIGDEPLYKCMQEASVGLGEALAKNQTRSFEIRPVFAVRR